MGIEKNYSAVFLSDGLSHNAALLRYQKRRERLLSTVKAPILLFGQDKDPFADSPWLKGHLAIIQEPLFLYLTGINQENCALFISADTIVLFLPEHKEEKEFWDGAQLAVGSKKQTEKISKLLGIKTILSISGYKRFLIQYFSKKHSQKELYLYWNASENGQKLQHDYLIRQRNRMKYFAKKYLQIVSIKNLGRDHWGFRLSLDNQSLKLLGKGIEKTKNIYVDIIKALPKERNEQGLQAQLLSSLYKQSPYGESFSPIVAAGKNACILHYVKNDEPISKNSLILLDFGIRWHSIVTDITRTVAASGKRNPLQDCVYKMVLTANAKVEKACKAGVSIESLNKIAWDAINQALQEEILEKGGVVKLPYKERPHQVSHLIAQQVHDGDAFRDYRKKPLEENQVISNEPGLYGYFELTINGKRYKEEIGVRIEDMLLVKKTKAICLSKDIPK